LEEISSPRGLHASLKASTGALAKAEIELEDYKEKCRESVTELLSQKEREMSERAEVTEQS